MPVAFERGGRVARCLEFCLSWLDAAKVKAVLAYRTDADRQGEILDVHTWPEWKDPRTSTVLHGLLTGLAAKRVAYSLESIGARLFSSVCAWVISVDSTQTIGLEVAPANLFDHQTKTFD